MPNLEDLDILYKRFYEWEKSRFPFCTISPGEFKEVIRFLKGGDATESEKLESSVKNVK